MNLTQRASTSHAQAAAEKHLPPLANASGRKLVCYDTLGRCHDLQFRFWVNVQARMYIVEGAHALQEAYGLSTGDALVFARAPDGRLIVYGRPGPNAPCRGVKLQRRIAEEAVETPPSSDSGSQETNTTQRCKRLRRPTAKAAAWAAVAKRSCPGSGEESELSTPIQAAWGSAYLSIEEQRKLLPTPVVDGVFRVMEHLVPSPPPSLGATFNHRHSPSHILLRAAHEQGVWLYDAGVWLATLIMPGGTVFQAAFETRAAAEDALMAASWC